jgi:diguanylate cyclase
MTSQLETMVRGPQGHRLARQALDDLERRQIWPTPVNYELWLHYLGEPEGDLGREIERMLAASEPFTDAVCEILAAAFLPRARLTDEIRDAGAQLSRELKSVAGAIAIARKSQEAYGRTLVLAGEGLERVKAAAPAPAQALIETLAQATRRVQIENQSLEHRLQDSTREVNRLREHLEQVRRDAMTDALTNLANRKAFDEQLARLCAEAHESHKPLTLAVIDIDHFKRFNDTWGHQTGDQVLRFVAGVIGKTATPPRVAARCGGEEFGMIFPEESLEAVEVVLNSVREEIGSRALKRRSTNEDLGAVTISAGVAQICVGETPSCLMERADEALYASKHGGRNRVTCAEPPAKAA